MSSPLRRGLAAAAAGCLAAAGLLMPATSATAVELPWSVSVKDHRDDVHKYGGKPVRRSDDRDLRAVSVAVANGTVSVRMRFSDLEPSHLAVSGPGGTPATSASTQLISGRVTTNVSWGDGKPVLAGWKVVDGHPRQVKLGACGGASQVANYDRDHLTYRVPVSCLAQKTATSAKAWSVVTWQNSKGVMLYDPMTVKWNDRVTRYTPKFRIR